MRVLVAEDNAVNQRFVLAVLERAGHTGVIASNGLEAVELATSQAFDAVLMDVQMPELDGFEATARIREAERQSGGRVPIVALTAHALRGDAERCLAAGMDGYLPKPVTPQEILAKLAEISSGLAVPTPADSTANVSNRHRLIGLLGGEAILRSVGGVFLKNAPQQLEQMLQAVAERNADGAGRLAHTLKGACAVFGAEEVVALFRQIEASAREEDWGGIEARLNDLSTTFDQLVDTLEVAVAP